MNLAKKFRDLADGMEKQIEGKINSSISQQRPTARRARIAGGMYEDGMKMKQIQAVLYRLAELHEARKVPKILQSLTAKSHIEDIMMRVYLPRPGAHSSYIRELLAQTRNLPGTRNDRQSLSRALEKCNDGFVELHPRQIFPALRLSRRALSRGKSRDADVVISSIQEYQRFVKLGFKTQEQYTQAREMLQLLAGDQGEISPREAEIRQAEFDLIGVKIPGFFVTPKALAERMVILADVRAGMKVLEPSAGNGSIAQAIREIVPEADLELVERNFKLRNILELKGFNLVDSDFLEHKGKYDRIIMNPPFENFQDIDHVLHAFECLKPGGFIVAIMCESAFFRKDRKAFTFRNWLENYPYLSEQLPSGTFSKEITSTGVVSRLITIQKPGRKSGAKKKELACVR